nr:cell division control protein 48 homolog B isoform X1 [Tanacetum cinerariifolium]
MGTADIIPGNLRNFHSYTSCYAWANNRPSKIPIFHYPHSVHRAHAGESEKVLRDAFAEASSHIKLGKPSVIFIDEIDAICPRRDSRKQQDIRISSQLIMLMDSSATSTSGTKVVVVASTNRVDALDPALRRSGRFDAEIEVTTPSEVERLQILEHILKATQQLASVSSAPYNKTSLVNSKGGEMGRVGRVGNISEWVTLTCCIGSSLG